MLLEEASKLKTNVNFVGKMNNDLVLEKLQNHQIYVSSTLFEGNPKSILEALSAGCIVIAPNVVGVDEIIKDQQNGFLYEPYPTELRNILNKILNYDLETVSKNAVEFISKNFAIDVVAKKELKLTLAYKTLVKTLFFIFIFYFYMLIKFKFFVIVSRVNYCQTLFL